MEIKICYIANKLTISVLTVLFVISVIYSCDKSDDMKNSRTEILIVAPKLELSGTLPDTGVQVKVMVANKENTDQLYYLYIGRIEGFEYIEGYEYKLKVLITKIPNPPMDGHLEAFKLLEIISKVKKAA